MKNEVSTLYSYREVLRSYHLTVLRSYLTLIIITIFTLNACKEHKGYTIQGELANANGLKVVLYKITPDTIPFKIDSCIIKKGKFMMKGRVGFPEYCAIYVGDNGPLLFLVENTEINIEFNLKDIQKSKVTGSKETDLFVEFNNKMADFLKFDPIQSPLDLSDSTLLMHDDIDSVRQQQVVIKPLQMLHVDVDSIRQLQIEYKKQFVEENPNSLVTAFVVDRHLSYHLQLEELELFANSFDAVITNSLWVQSIIKKTKAAKLTETGQPFIDLKMLTPNGDEISISDYVGKKKYLLIYFWASWCGQSRKENPEVVKLYNKHKDKELEIIGISLDKNKEEWTKAIEDDELTWQQMSDLEYLQSEGVRLYSAYSLPYTVLLDKDGIIIAKGIQLNEIEEKITEKVVSD